MYTPQRKTQTQYNNGQNNAMSNQRSQPVYNVRTAPGLRPPVQPNVPMPQQPVYSVRTAPGLRPPVQPRPPPNYNPNIIYNRMPIQKPLKPSIPYQPYQLYQPR